MNMPKANTAFLIQAYQEFMASLLDSLFQFSLIADVGGGGRQQITLYFPFAYIWRYKEHLLDWCISENNNVLE